MRKSAEMTKMAENVKIGSGERHCLIDKLASNESLTKN